MWRLGEVQRAAICARRCIFLNRSFLLKWLFVLIDFLWFLIWRCRNDFLSHSGILSERNQISNRIETYHMSSHVNKMILHCPFRVRKTWNSWNMIVLIIPVLADFRSFTPILDVLRKFEAFLWHFNIFFPCLVISHSFFVPIHLLPLRRVVLYMFSFTILLDIERPLKLTLWILKK